METVRNILNSRSDLRKYLFIRGFLLTDRANLNLSEFPFYENWKKEALGGYVAYVHRLTGFHSVEQGGRQFFLFGHSYNPFTEEIDEAVQLKRIADAYGSDVYQDRIDELTGVFAYGVIENSNITFLADPAGMQSAYFGCIDGHFYLTSHSQLIGDICHLQRSDLTEELLSYRWYYRVMGAYLPADMTQFDEVKRIVPNIAYTFAGSEVRHQRFYPLKPLSPIKSETEYWDIIREGANILKTNMRLVTEKWNNPQISLTGGIDSNTTFAAANGVYDKIKTFSYLSAKKEEIDVNAAEKIAGHFNVPWTLYRIPDDEESLRDYAEIAAIIDHNNGFITRRKGNECRKRVYLTEHLDCDVEVKSWVSETIRGYWYKHYGRSKMPPLSSKLFRNLYKIFLLNRHLAHKIDAVFEKYIRDFEYEKIPDCYPPADMHYNEVTWGSWGGLNISEMKIYSDITMIYNNRKFLDLMFRVPLKKRISDRHHLDMKRILNRELYDMNIRVVNMKETRLRAFLLNVIFTANMVLPG